MTNKDWTDDLRHKMENHLESVPDDLWTKIEDKLDNPLPRRKAISIPLRRWAVAAVAVGIATGAVLMWHPESNYLSERQLEESREEQSYISEPEQEESNPTIQQNAQNGQVRPVGTVGTVRTVGQVGQVGQVRPVGRGDELLAENYANQPNAQDAEEYNAEEYNAQDAEDYNAQDAVKPDADADKQENATSYYDSESSFNDNKMTYTLPANEIAPITSKKKQKPSIKLYASGNLSGSSTMSHPQTFYMYNMLYYNSFAATNHVVNTVNSMSTKHYPPFSVGLSYKHPLTNRLWVDVGAAYTRFRSDFTSHVIHTELKEEQTLHYVGVPISLGITLWESGGVSAYGTGGIQTDFNVKSTKENNGNRVDTERDRVQFSVLAGIGAEYDFTPNAGIYIEPQMKYYPDNGSSVENYFKENKLGFNIELGVRIIY